MVETDNVDTPDTPLQDAPFHGNLAATTTTSTTATTTTPAADVSVTTGDCLKSSLPLSSPSSPPSSTPTDSTKVSNGSDSKKTPEGGPQLGGGGEKVDNIANKKGGKNVLEVDPKTSEQPPELPTLSTKESGMP